MIKGKTDSGFEFEIDERRLEDIRIVDAVATVEKGVDMVVAAKAYLTIRQVLLGAEQNERLIAFIGGLHAEEDIIPAKEVNDTIIEIMGKEQPAEMTGKSLLIPKP